MKALKRILFSVFLVSLLCCCLGAQTAADPVIEDPIDFSNARLTALGGYHAALSDDIMTIFNNPAGFHSIGSEFLISEVTIGLTGPIFDVTSSILSAVSEGSAILDNPQMIELVAGIYAGLDLIGPIAFAYAGNGLAFGFFNWADMTVESKGALNVGATASENILITGGYCFRIPINSSFLDIGLQLKAIFRGTVDFSSSVLDIFSSIQSDPLALLTNSNFVLSMGGGADLGVIYHMGELLSIGLVARNIYTPTMRSKYATLTSFLEAGTPTPEIGLVPLDLSGGVRVAPPLGILNRIITDFKIVLDYSDILDFWLYPATAKHWLLHLGAGVELSLLEILSVRAGFAQGLFAAGIGLDLTIFKMSASMFGSELSLYPGMRSVYNLVLGLEFTL